MKKQLSLQKGITLIALVITIIVLIILAGVTIATLSGPNGILTNANEAQIKTEVASEKENISLAVTTVRSNNYMNGGTGKIEQTELQSSLDQLFGTNKAIAGQKQADGKITVTVVETNRNYEIDTNGVITENLPGIKDKVYVVNSTDVISLSDIITQEDIKAEGITTCQIIGVMTTEDGSSISSGSIQGKNGTMTIVNLNNRTFQYQLNQFMHGQDVFYLKLKINESEERTQKITFQQGNIMYQEDFAGITYSNPGVVTQDNDTTTEWWKLKYNETTGTFQEKIKIDEPNGYTNGKGNKIVAGGTSQRIEFEFSGTGLDLILKATQETNIMMIRIYEKGEDGTFPVAPIRNLSLITTIDNTDVHGLDKIITYSDLAKLKDLESGKEYKAIITIGGTSTCYLDAVKVIK